MQSIKLLGEILIHFYKFSNTLGFGVQFAPEAISLHEYL